MLPDHPLPSGEIHLIYPDRRLLAKRTRVFMDTVREAFAAKSCLQPGYLDGLRARSVPGQ